MEEEWKDIKGYEGRYQISSFGRVKSLNYRCTGREKILDFKSTNSRGYVIAKLCKEGKVKSYTVHKLVAEAFIPNPNNYKEINHRDENKINNHVSNLEWCTRKYNCNYGTRNKRVSKSHKGKTKGSKNGRARKILCVTTGKPFNCIKDAAKCYSINYSTLKGGIKKGSKVGKHPVTGELLEWRYL